MSVAASHIASLPYFHFSQESSMYITYINVQERGHKIKLRRDVPFFSLFIPTKKKYVYTFLLRNLSSFSRTEPNRRNTDKTIAIICKFIFFSSHYATLLVYVHKFYRFSFSYYNLSMSILFLSLKVKGSSIFALDVLRCRPWTHFPSVALCKPMMMMMMMMIIYFQKNVGAVGVCL